MRELRLDTCDLVETLRAWEPGPRWQDRPPGSRLWSHGLQPDGTIASYLYEVTSTTQGRPMLSRVTR